MGKVVFDISMSLDGFVTAANARPEAGLGDGGERLHQWAFSDDDHNRKSRELLQDALAGAGAVICGRRTYDLAMPGWGTDGPSGSVRLPVFVLTHRAPDDAPAGGVYTFVTNGIHSALQQARAAAGDKAVSVMGGADVARQFIRAGLVDELSIHLVPVLFGSGTRLFDHLGDEHIQLEVAGVVDTPLATHLTYRLAKRPARP